MNPDEQKDPLSKDLIFNLQIQLPRLNIISRTQSEDIYMLDCIPVLVFHKEYLQFNYREPSTNRHIQIGGKMYNEEDIKREVMYLMELARTGLTLSGRHLEVLGSDPKRLKSPWEY